MKFLILCYLSIISCVYSEVVDLKTCGDLRDAVDKSIPEASMNTDITCDEFTTFTISGYDMIIHTSKSTTFRNVRFEVINGAELTFGDSIVFRNILEVTNENSYMAFNDLTGGGALYIGEESSVIVEGDFKTSQMGLNAEESSDGGCIWNNGNFYVGGKTVMDECYNLNSAGYSPGKGGAIFNYVNGTMTFVKGVDMSKTSLTDDGNKGAGFFNLGRVTIKGASRFYEMHSSVGGGAIYNGVGAVFNFKDNASAIFNRCADPGVVSHGKIKFAGPAIFIEDRSTVEGSQIKVGSTGSVKLKKNSYFFRNYEGQEISESQGYDPVVEVCDGGEFKYPKKTFFAITGLPEGVCGGVYFEKDDVCM